MERTGILEYVYSDLRSNESTSEKVHFANSVDKEAKSNVSDSDSDRKVSDTFSSDSSWRNRAIDDSDLKKGERVLCWIHMNEYHNIAECPSFLKMTVEERFQGVRDNNVCWSCFKPGNKSIFCYKRKKCNESDCEMSHHKLLHEKLLELLTTTNLTQTRLPYMLEIHPVYWN